VFDFRYHVASLIAVFIALVIGILVGIGLSGRGFVSDAERKNLEHQISQLTSDRDAARAQLAQATTRETATEHYADETYAALVKGRLDKKRIGLAFLGGVDHTVDSAVTQAVRASGGRLVRLRAFRLPIDDKAVTAMIAKRPVLLSYGGPGGLHTLARDIAAELVLGGKTPLLDVLGDVLLEEREGGGKPPLDGIVLCHTTSPQEGASQDFLSGLYAGLADLGTPTIGVERSTPPASAVKAFTRAGLSTVDSVETSAGRLALVLELAGADAGHYGVRTSATSGRLPPVAPVGGTGG
jgi:hypothetical protein